MAFIVPPPAAVDIRIDSLAQGDLFLDASGYLFIHTGPQTDGAATQTATRIMDGKRIAFDDPAVLVQRYAGSVTLRNP